MRNILLSACTLVLMVAHTARAVDPKPHPLFGNDVLGQSAEIAALWMGGPGGVACGMRIYDFQSSSITPEAASYAFGPTTSDYKQQSIVSGDFDGDGDDEIVVAFKQEVLANTFLIGAVMINVDNGTLNCSNLDTIWTCCVKDYWYTNWEATYLRLFTGNFDADSTMELGMIYVNTSLSPNGRIQIRLMDWQAGSGFVEITESEIDAPTVDLKEQLVFDAASGDFDGDGKDEIVAAGVRKYTSTNYMVYLKTYQVIPAENRLEQTAVDTPFTYSQYVNEAGEGHWVDRLVLSTGDMSGNTLDDVALAFEYVETWWIWGFTSNYHVKSRGYLKTFRVDTTLAAIEEKASTDYYLGDEVVAHCSGAAYYHPRISGRAMGLAAGDLNLDGKEDLLWVVKDHVRTYRTSGQLALTFDAWVAYDNRWNEQSWQVVQIADLNANPADSIWSPEVILGDWGGGSEKYRIRVVRWNHDSSGVFTGGTQLSQSVEAFTINNVSVVTGDFNGSSIRLGEPTPHIIEGVPQPLVIMKAPPIHFDIFNDTVFNVNSCYESPPCDFYAEYTQSTGSVKLSSTTLKRDWGVGANISGEYTAMSIGAKTSLSLKYGEEFSKESTVSETFDVSTSVKLWYDDMVFVRKYDYQLWEYPIYSDNALQEERVLVVVPYLTQAVNQWLPAKSIGAAFYAPNHEVGNIMSYYNYGVLENNPEMQQRIFAETGLPVNPGSTADWSIAFGHFTSEGQNQTQNSQIEIGASVSAFGLEVGVEGNYGRERFTTQTTSVSDDVSLNVFLDMISLNAQTYHVTPYAYWATNGALVLDYAVTPEGGASFWTERYDQTCDPAFILPWRYDLERGFGDPGVRKYETRDIRFIPSQPECGDTIRIAARVNNFSLKPTPGVVIVHFYVGDPTAGGQRITDINGSSEFYTSGPVDPRSYRDIEITWIIPDTLPHYPDIYAILDPHNLLSEVHENNNKGYRLLPVEGISVSVDDDEQSTLPDSPLLSPNYPNPFNPVTTISYNLPQSSRVKLEIFNTLGQRVATLVDQVQPAGPHTVRWNGTNVSGARASSGLYLYRLQAGEHVQTRKMLLLK